MWYEILCLTPYVFLKSAYYITREIHLCEKIYPWCGRDAFAVGLPAVWVDDSEEIVVNIQRAQLKMAELVKVHAKAFNAILWRWQ